MTLFCDARGGGADIARFRPGDEHPGQRKARGGLREFRVSRLCRELERDGDDQFALA